MNIFAHAGHDHTSEILQSLSTDPLTALAIGLIVTGLVILCAVFLRKQTKKKSKK